MYQCESAVGDGILHSKIPREELWLTSKLDNCDHAPDRVAQACREQLKDLKTEYLDLFLIHWPLTGKAGPTLDPPIKVLDRVSATFYFNALPLWNDPCPLLHADGFTPKAIALLNAWL